MLLLVHATDRLQAYLLRDILRMHNIRAHVFNEHMTSIVGELPPDIAMPQLWLDEDDDLRRAQEVLRAHARQAEQRTPSFCTDCGEENPATFETCWSCGACIWTA